MPNAVKWSALGTRTLVINGDASAPTLKNLANGARVLGAEIDGATDRNQVADWHLDARGASAFAVGSVVEVYFVVAHDDTNYEDGDSSITPAKAPDFIVPLRNVSTQQKVVVRGIPLPPFKFKPLFVNTSGVALTNTDNENRLYYRAYNDEIQ
jgi:hypothetical protein